MTWETTKIKTDVKERAKEDPRTYTEIMADGLDQDPEQGREQLIKDIREQLDTLEETKDQISMANEPGVEIETQKLIDRLDELEAAVKEATDAAQSAEKKVEKIEELRQ